MSYIFINYPNCSTCREAKKFLLQNEVSFLDRHIIEETPSVDELKTWLQLSNLPIKKFFNTSGNVYKSMHLKDTLASMSDDEKIALLASDGMLLKRPLLIGDKTILVGFKEEDYKSLL